MIVQHNIHIPISTELNNKLHVHVPKGMQESKIPKALEITPA